MEINGSNYDYSIFWSEGKKEWGSEVILNRILIIYIYKEEKV